MQNLHLQIHPVFYSYDAVNYIYALEDITPHFDNFVVCSFQTYLSTIH
jgi:hypothetical protein